MRRTACLRLLSWVVPAALWLALPAVAAAQRVATPPEAPAPPAPPPAMRAAVPPAPPAPPALVVPIPQTPPAPPAPPPPPQPGRPAPPPTMADTLYKVEVLFERFQGDKKVASLPYTLYASGGARASLRLGLQVPLQSGPGQVTYQGVGTTIGIRVTEAPASATDTYVVDLNLSRNWTIAADTPAGASTGGLVGRPVIGSENFTGVLRVHDGRPLEFSAQTDPTNGDAVRSRITVTAVP